MSKQPNAFVPGQGGGYRPAQVQVSQTYEARAPYGIGPQQVPPAPPMPTLSITPKGILHLHSSLRERLKLRYGQPIDLVPPVWNSMYWYLDLRPEAARRVLWNDGSRPRVAGISLPPGLVTAPLTLYLLPGEPEYAHYYPLLPSNAFTAAK